jgi:transposase InsO family protein
MVTETVVEQVVQALDLGSRRCVGWAIRDTMEVDLVTSARRMARAARQPAPGLISVGDRGSQYAPAAYRTELTAHEWHSRKEARRAIFR